MTFALMRFQQNKALKLTKQDQAPGKLDTDCFRTQVMKLLMPILTGEEQLNDDSPNKNGAKELGSEHESGKEDFAEQIMNDYRCSYTFSDLF
jgi:hypothetical protein